MSTIVIIGSTKFAPLSDIDDYLRGHEIDQIVAWGTSPLADHVCRVRPDAKRLDPTNTRDELINIGREPRTMIVAFTAVDPESKTVSQGTQDNINLLQTNGIDVKEIGSSLTPSQASLYYEIENRLIKLSSTAPSRRGFQVKRILESTEKMREVRADLERTLESEDIRMRLAKVPNDSEENDRWIRNLNRGVTMSKLIRRVEEALGTGVDVRAA